MRHSVRVWCNCFSCPEGRHSRSRIPSSFRPKCRSVFRLPARQPLFHVRCWAASWRWDGRSTFVRRPLLDLNAQDRAGGAPRTHRLAGRPFRNSLRRSEQSADAVGWNRWHALFLVLPWDSAFPVWSFRGSRLRRSPLDAIIIAQFLTYVNNFFKIFQKIFFVEKCNRFQNTKRSRQTYIKWSKNICKAVRRMMREFHKQFFSGTKLPNGWNTVNVMPENIRFISRHFFTIEIYRRFHWRTKSSDKHFVYAYL